MRVVGQHTSSKTRKQIRNIVVFTALFLLCWLFPYTGDDWAWGSQIGLDRLSSAFKGYGGRYLGYMIVLCLTRSVFLRAAAMSSILLGFCVLSEIIIEREYAYYVTLFFLVLMPKQIARQAVIWTSGFSNYATSTFFSLLYTGYVFHVLRIGGVDKDPPSKVFLPCAGMALLGLANSLIVENMSLYHVLISFIILGVYNIRFHKLHVPLMAHGIANLFGTLCMFLNSAYRELANSEGTYRSLAWGAAIIQKMHDNWNYVILKEGIISNHVLNISFFVICILSLIILTHVKKTSLIAIIAGVIFGSFTLYTLFSVLCPVDGKSLRFIHCEGYFSIIGLASLFFLILYIAFRSGENNVFFESIYIIFSVVIMIAPLLVVTPIGSRNFLSSYLYCVFLFCELTKALEITCVKYSPGLIEYRPGTVIKPVLISCIWILYGIYIVLFIAIHRTDVSRQEYIMQKADSGSKRIEIIHFPNESFLWTATPEENSIWEYRYKLFHKIPDEISLVPVWEYSS